MRYEFTITLKPTMYRLSAREQFRSTRDQVLEVCRPFKISIVAELTSQNNVHYHAMVDLRDFKQRDQLLNRVRKFYKTLGRTTCTQLVNEIVWIEYLRKHVHVTDHIIESWPWLKDDYEISGQLKFKCTPKGLVYIEGYNPDADLPE